MRLYFVSVNCEVSGESGLLYMQDFIPIFACVCLCILANKINKKYLKEVSFCCLSYAPGVRLMRVLRGYT